MMLQDRTILLTGGSSGIGAATAARLAAEGAYVISHFRVPEERAAAEAALSDVPADRRQFLTADFADPAAVDKLWREALAWRGHIDAVVLNAAMNRWDGGPEDSDADWDSAWDELSRTNLIAPARLIRRALPHFVERGSGVFVTFSSWVAQRGATQPGQMAYAATKAALHTVARTVARGYANKGVLSYVIAPGVVRTKMSEDFAARQGGEAIVTAGLAMGEWVPPTEIGELVAFLCTGRVRHLSGATLDVNGASYVR